MGFGKKNRDAHQKTPSPENKARGKAPENKFRGTTAEELKEIEKRARKKSEERKRDEDKRGSTPERIALEMNHPLKNVDAEAFVGTLERIINDKRRKYDAEKNKSNKWQPSLPQYEKWETPERADANFIYDIQATLANLSWKELGLMLHAAAGKEIATKDFSEAFHFVQAVMYQVLHVTTDESALRYKLSKREATLKLWPVKPKEMSMNTKVSKNEDEGEDEGTTSKKKPKAEKSASKKDTDKSAKKEGSVKLADSSTITKVKDREKGGGKSKLLNMIPKKGITLKALVEAASEHDVSASKVKSWVNSLASYGYVAIK